MRATIRMQLDTLFGNRAELEVSAELTNTHDPDEGAEETNRQLLEDMTRVLTYAIAAIAAEDDRHRRAMLENKGAEPVAARTPNP